MKKDSNILKLDKNYNGSTDISMRTIPFTNTRKREGSLHTFIKELMFEGIDYGKIAGYSKPTLLKPGAEKICQYMKLSISYEVSHRYEDWQEEMFYYEVRVGLKQLDSLQIVSEGIGSANTKEEQYACQNPFTIINTVLKIAKKRALVDAVLNISATSGIFTQDIEDKPNKTELEGGDGTITRCQLAKIHQLVKEQEMNPDVAKQMMKMVFNVDHSTKLSKTQASSFIQDLLLLGETQGR